MIYFYDLSKNLRNIFWIHTLSFVLISLNFFFFYDYNTVCEREKSTTARTRMCLTIYG